MRKFLISSALALLIVGAVSAADIELGINYFAVPYQSFSGEDDTKVTLPEPAGVEVNASFFFGSPCSFIDLGLNVRGGVGFVGWFNGKEDGEKEKYDVEGGWDAFFKIGPTIRFNLGEMHSIVVAPGFQFNYGLSNDNGRYNPDYELECPKFDLEIGYRCWFIHSPNYNFGLDVGTDLQWYSGYIDCMDCGGYNDYYNEGDPLEVDGGFAWKIYVGVCFNWGKRSIYRH